MARSVLVVTEVYQLASSKTARFTIKKEGKGTLFINTVNTDDDTAEAFSGGVKGDQAEQLATEDTFIRASVVNAGWLVIVAD